MNPRVASNFVNLRRHFAWAAALWACLVAPAVAQTPDEKPAAEKPVAEKPAAEKPAAEKPVPEKPVPEKPVPEKPVPEKPVPEKPVAEKPASEKPAAEKPASEKPATPPPTSAPAPPVATPPAPTAPGLPLPPVNPLPIDPLRPDARIYREQTIYVPYSKLRNTFEQEGRGVFLPYERFQELWRAAQGKQGVKVDAPPPVGSLITEIESEAVVERDVLRVTAKLKVDLLSAGWHRLPLRLGDAAILSAKWGDEPAHVVFEGDGYHVLVKHSPASVPAPAAAPPGGDLNASEPPPPPKRVELSLEYAKAYVKQPGRNSVSFEAPQAPVNRWRVRVPQTGTKVTIEPLIAASEQVTTKPAEKPSGKPGEKPNEKPGEKTSEGETIVLAFVGAAPTVKIDWTAKSEGAAGLAALVNVQARQQVQVDEGVLRTQATLLYDITRADVAQFQIEAPGDQRVINVFDANVRQWDVKPQGDKQVITVQLFQPARGPQQVVVELERILADMNQKELVVPTVKAMDVGRQQGVVLLRLGGELRAEVTKRVGLTQLDPSELPAEAGKGRWDFMFRYATLPLELSLAVQRVEPRVQVDELVEVFLEPEQLTVDLFAAFTIERAGVFQIELSIPTGYDVRDVRGHAAPGVEAAAIDAHQIDAADKTKLIVNLARKSIGKIGVVVELNKRLDDPNLLTPNGKSSAVELPTPRAATGGLERVGGKLVLFAPESLRVNPQTLTGLRNIPISEAYQGATSLRGGRFPLTREVLAFAYGKPAVAATVAVERRRPAITARQLLVARCDTGVIKYETTFFYDIRYSSVKSLRIDVPQSLAAKLHNDTPTIREKTLENADPPPAEGYVAWSFSGETELLGSTTIKLNWEEPLEELGVGKSRDVAVPKLQPRGADLDRAWGQVVVTKAETLDIHPTGTPRGLRPIDPQHDLMPGANIADAARAFEFQQDDWQLALKLQRYELEDVKRTSVETALLRMVVTRSGETAVQSLFRLRSARQRLAVKLPAGFQLDTQPLRIDGQRHDLERGENDELYIPLVNRAAGEPVVVELRYTVPKSASRLQLPQFLDDPAMQQVYVAAYLPKEWTLLGWRGPWTEEYEWRWDSPVTALPETKRTDAELLGLVNLGVAHSVPTPDDFPVDGVRYLFSTLRPAQSDESTLIVASLSRKWLHFLVVLSVFGVGVAGARRGWADRALAAFAVVGVLVVAGVFLPTLARQAADAAFWAATAVVVIGWFTASLVGWMRRPR